MGYRRAAMIALLALPTVLLLPGGLAAATATATATGSFSGEILPVFYVSDSRESVEFYLRLGFKLDYYHDYDTGEDLQTWDRESMPIYIEMDAGGQKFALHLIGENDTLNVGGMRHYFGVSDVDAHRALITGNGIETSKIYDRPWMRMFFVKDPDGHVLFFFTRP